MAWPSDTPLARSNDSVTDGSWPEWLTVTGPTSFRKCATALSGTSGLPLLGATNVPTLLPGGATPLPAPGVLVRTYRDPSDAMSCWYWGRTSSTTQYSYVGV